MKRLIGPEHYTWNYEHARSKIGAINWPTTSRSVRKFHTLLENFNNKTIMKTNIRNSPRVPEQNSTVKNTLKPMLYSQTHMIAQKNRKRKINGSLKNETAAATGRVQTNDT